MRMMKKISIFILSLLLISCVANNKLSKENYKLFNKKFYFNDDTKLNLKEYLGVKPEIVKNGSDIFIISLSKNIIKISLTNKKVDWIKTINTVPENNFTFDDSNIYFNGINNNFYILNYKTGDIEYIYLNSNVSTITEIKKPIIYKNFIIAFFNENRLIVFNKNNKQIFLDKSYNKITVNDGILNIDGKIFDLNKI